MGELGVDVTLTEERATLGVRGEIDLVTAPALEALVVAVTDRRPREVVVDLAGVTFLGASGLRVIASAAARLSAGGGGDLVVSSPSALHRRLFAITGLDEVARVEVARPERPRLGAEQQEPEPRVGAAAEPGGDAGAGEGNVERGLRRLLTVQASRGLVDAALGLVVALAQATLRGADGVSVSLTRHGSLVTAAASDAVVSDMDAEQYATGEGPCVAASLQGRWFHADSLAEEERWPSFTPRALGLGIQAILSSPLLVGGVPIGALNIYSRSSHAFAPEQQQLATRFATEAAGIVAEGGVGVSVEVLSDRLTEALRTREVIAQAQGAVMARERLSAEEAYSSLRRLASERSMRLAELAAATVASLGGEGAGTEDATRSAAEGGE
ncbi:MAG: anti-sigma factor antagonist [Acidimicrobiales bacterium]